MQPFGDYMSGRMPQGQQGGGFGQFLAGRQVQGMGGQTMPAGMAQPGAGRTPPATPPPPPMAPPTVSQRFADFAAQRQRMRAGQGQGGAPAIAQAAQQRAQAVVAGGQQAAQAQPVTTPPKPMPGAQGMGRRPEGLER
jgi:hypothetical protein